MPVRIVVNGYSEGWLRKGFPWVYPKEIVRGRARPGQWVELYGPAGTILGTGVADAGFLAARVMRHGEGPVDREHLFAVLDRAAALRDAVVDPDTTGFRLVHAENDGLPGVRIDWWSHWAVIVLDSPALACLLDPIVEWLHERRAPRGIALCYRRDARDTDKVGDGPPPGLLAGHAPTAAVRVRERGMCIDVMPLDGPDVGLYSDMRGVRAWLEPHWGGTRVVNTFAYTGAFSVAAALGGASEVVSVDLSVPSLERARANFRANDLDPDAFEFEATDVFKSLDRLRRTGRRFDRVVLDPPAFSRGEQIWSAKKDIPRLVGAAARLLDDNGWLIAASNQGELSPRAFDGLIADGLRKARRPAQLIHVATQGPDFPAASWFPEGRYLKVRIFRLL